MSSPLPYSRTGAYAVPRQAMASHLFEQQQQQHNSTAAFFGNLWPFLLIIPYGLAMGLQDINIRAACIVGLASSGALCLLGLALMLLQARRIWPYLFELALTGVFAVCLGLQYVDGGKWEQQVVWRSFTFIVNTAMAVLALVSVLAMHKRCPDPCMCSSLLQCDSVQSSTKL